MSREFHDRLTQCERANRRFRAILYLALPLLLGVALVGFTVFQDRMPATEDTLQVRELVVVDSQGVERVRIGAHLPDAVVDGQPRPRGQDVAGILLYDDTGRERSGYVTFAPSRNVALTLDTRDRQVALFSAGPEGGAVARLWNPEDSDWVAMRAGEGGARFTAGSANEIVFQEPPMAQDEADALCSAFRAEVSELDPRPPADQLLAACKRRLPEEQCAACLDIP